MAWANVGVGLLLAETPSTAVGMARTKVATASIDVQRVPAKVGSGWTVGGTAAVTGGKLLRRVRAFDPKFN
jgi:hypothetical protein